MVKFFRISRRLFTNYSTDYMLNAWYYDNCPQIGRYVSLCYLQYLHTSCCLEPPEKVSIMPYIKQTWSLTQRKEAIFQSSTSITTGTWPRTIFPSTKPHREQDYSAGCVIRLCTIVVISLFPPPSPSPIPLPSYTQTHKGDHS